MTCFEQIVVLCEDRLVPKLRFMVHHLFTHCECAEGPFCLLTTIFLHVCKCNTDNFMLQMQEGMRILMSRHALSMASLDDVLIALLDGFEALSESTGEGTWQS